MQCNSQNRFNGSRLRQNGAPTGDRGAALVIALFIMFILLAIALTFYTVSRIQFQTATNVGNTVRAELLSEAATALAINALKKDSVVHPHVTSTDHEWTTRFNGLWAAEKTWARPPWHPSIANGGIPIVFFDNYEYVNPITGQIFNAPGVGNGAELMPQLFVPRVEPQQVAAVPNETGHLGYDVAYDELGVNRFVFEPMLEPTLTYAQRVDPYCDVDNDGDGYRDSIWVPLAQDYLLEADKIDFNLDRPEVTTEPPPNTPEYQRWLELNQPRSAILFYPGAYEARNGVNAWFLTAPLLAPDGSYITLRNHGIPGVPSPISTSPMQTVNDVPGGRRLVDAIDNDYDGIINYHVEYYAIRPTAAEPYPVPTAEQRLDRIVTNAEFERLLSLGFTEIKQDYLDPSLGFRVCTTGEPFCELAGRAAILIRDETSKVNMNAAGAHYLDAYSLLAANLDPAAMIQTFGYSIDKPPFFMQYWQPAFWWGASPAEYLSSILPRTGPGRALKFWNILMGAPNGCMLIGDNLSLPMNPLYFYDVTMPGYGFVDDNANAFMLAFNGIDDNGNGLIDEGVNTGVGIPPEQVEAAYAYAERSGWIPNPDENYTPPAGLAVSLNQSATQIAAEVYGRFIEASILEGVDEPAEFQLNNPLRNRLAEDSVPDAPIGLFGDRPLPTRDYLKRAVLNEEYGSGISNLATGLVNRLRPFVAVESGLKNNRTEQNENKVTETLGPKLNYNVASAAQLAKAFIDDWKLDEKLLYNPDAPELGTRYQTGDIDRFLGDQMSADESAIFWANAFLHGMRIEGVLQEGVAIGGQTLQPQPDPRLRAMQVAANIVDSADIDHARTELSTDQLQQFEFDPWWYALQVSAGTPADMAKRPISYTVAGTEAIRINEIMPRPVRRVEAEAITDGTDPAYSLLYDPNAAFGSVAAFNVEKRQFTDGMPAGGYTMDVGGTGWSLAPAAASSVIGLGSAMRGQKESLAVSWNPALPPPPLPGTLPNIIEFEFTPSQQLPPGRYYLTVSTINPETGQPTIRDGQQDTVHYAVKYVSSEVVPANTFSSNLTCDILNYWIFEDVFALAVANDPSWSDLFRNDARVGYENQRNPQAGTESGLLFLSGKQAPGLPNYDPLAPPTNPGYSRGIQAHTVTIPTYTSGASLHVAIYCDDSSAAEALSINFFDFSQEPDHEWVEVENISSQPVNIAGWELVVGGVNSEGNVVTEDKVVMRVPVENGPVVLEPSPPYNRALLAVSAISPPVPDVVGAIGFYGLNPFTLNGIGQVGTPGKEAIYDFGLLNCGDTTVPLIPHRVAGEWLDPAWPVPEGWVDDGRGLPRTPEWSPFEAADAERRIIQLKIPGLNAELGTIGDDMLFIAKWVLRGGVFPNYPEHDAVDNDYDAHILAVDGVDYTVEGNLVFPYGLGVDEGRWAYGPATGGPGSFSWNPIPLFLMSPEGAILSRFYPPGEWPSLDYPYLWEPDGQPEWKEFTERRLYPGDNVVVSLFQGAHELRRVVDRITYTERDVINRAIGCSVTVQDPDDAETLIRPPLHYNPLLATVSDQPYLDMWPDNTMGMDFYRSLERKYHPLYNGDRFGTQNRWQATDGNYDDWSHFVVEDPVNDGYQPAAFCGTPLARNDAAWKPENYAPGLAEKLLYQLDTVDVRNKPFESVAETLSLPHVALNKPYTPYGGSLPLGTVEDFQPVVKKTFGYEDGLGSIVEAGVTESIYLSPGAGVYRSIRPAVPSDEQLTLNFTGDGLNYVLPQAWRPFYTHSISSPTSAEGPPPATLDPVTLLPVSDLPGDGFYWLFNEPARPAGLEDPEPFRNINIAEGFPKSPARKRAVLFASQNLDNTTGGGAKLYVQWDAESGLQDGTYDLYIDTGLKLLEAPDAPLTPTGRFLRSRMLANIAERPGMNITVYTDRNRDGRIDRAPDTGIGSSVDSYGRKTNLRPDSQGYIWFGTVAVNNNRLALDIENVAKPLVNLETYDILNTFAGAILTPSARTQGRININTTETRIYRHETDDYRRLNVLAGLPGIYRAAPDTNDWSQYTFTTTADILDAGSFYDFGVLFLYSGRGGYLLRIMRSPGVDGDPTVVGTASLHEIVDGTLMPAFRSTPFTGDTPNITVAVTANPPDTDIICTVQGAGSLDAQVPLRFGGVALMSANQNAGFVPAPAITVRDIFGSVRTETLPFNRGWSGPGWIINPDFNLYMPGGLSAISEYNGYLDWADPDYYAEYDTPPSVTAGWSSSDPNFDSASPYMRAEWVAKMRTHHWDGRYYESVMDLLNVEPHPLHDDMRARPLALDIDNYGDEFYPDYMDPVALRESTWRLSRMANQITTRSDIFEIIVTVQAGTGDDSDGDGIINYRSPQEFTVTSERQTRTVYERP